LEDEFDEMAKERRRGGPVNNLREDDPETANPAGVDGFRVYHNRAYPGAKTDHQVFLMQNLLL
jgi:hypothetical protein